VSFEFSPKSTIFSADGRGDEEVCANLESMAKPLVWFRADLRTRDNHALAEASRTAEPVPTFFLIGVEQGREHDRGTPRIDFVLRRLGIPSLIRPAPRGAALHADPGRRRLLQQQRRLAVAASTGRDAALYFRMFHPASQRKRYDPRG